MLTLSNLTYCLNQRQKILNSFSFSFSAGQIYAITGANGSGKSTLAQLIMGIITPTSGKIYLNNQEITSFRIDQRARMGIGLSMQNPVTFKGLNVTNLLEIAAGKMLNSEELASALDCVGLSYVDYAKRQLDKKLSGGELKRIEIALTLILNPMIYVFDEPEAGIDLWSFQQLIDIFTHLKSRQKVVIIITHQERILSSADHILLMENGRLETTGSYNQLRALLPN